ncbi:hypothetical protein H8E88_12795 [candidate division KSB1 bacterium]|nr:hypothetical protein [candidate division KSB1 bacterium]MBL7094855.1 hypothetical protein [candidate division KSB1 bacterium]
MLESIIKIVLVVVLLLAALCFWLLPKTKLAKKLKMTVPIFITTNIVGIACGIFGLVGIFIWKEFIIEAHLWELIIFPYTLVWVYWLMVIRLKKTSIIVDEKQEWDMSQAAGSTIAGTLLILAFMFNLSYNDVYQLNNGMWFPFYLFTTILLFSVSTLLFFKKS